MSGVNYLDGDTERQARQALRDGKTLEYVAGYLNMDTELLGRLLQLPDVKPVEAGHDGSAEFDLWACDQLDAVL